MAKITFINESHKRVHEEIINAGLLMRRPIMLTANQFEDTYTVSLGLSTTNIRIPKEALDKEELKAIGDSDYGGKIIINNVWEAML